MHWGIHSVVGAQPSWDMIANYEWGGRVSPPDKYYALAERFNPRDYDPNKYLKAAKDAGFTYAVLTTKHHDGYALWPSKYGIGTKQYMNGRDLLKEYVDACRANGLKVGFYFSPRDWHYPGLMHPNEFDAKTWRDLPPITDSAANQQAYEQFLAFVMAQMEELLTRYGKIDMLWLDGMNWRGVADMHTEQVYAWIRSLQPGILVNDRWAEYRSILIIRRGTVSASVILPRSSNVRCLLTSRRGGGIIATSGLPPRAPVGAMIPTAHSAPFRGSSAIWPPAARWEAIS